MVKEGNQIEVEVCGWSVGVYSKLSQLWKFYLRNGALLVDVKDEILKALGKEDYIEQLFN